MFVGYTRSDLPMSNNLVKNNILYSMNPNPKKTLMIWASDSMQINTPFNNNCYRSPNFNDIYYIIYDHWLYSTIEEFQQLSGIGQGAKWPLVDDYSKSILVYVDIDSIKNINLSYGVNSDIEGNLLPELVLYPFLSR